MYCSYKQSALSYLYIALQNEGEIAKRTRSKYPLTDTSISVIEGKTERLCTSFFCYQRIGTRTTLCGLFGL